MQPSIPQSSSVFVIERTAIIHPLKCTVPFSLFVPLLSLIAICCHSLHYSLSLVAPLVVTCCHSLSLVVPLVVTRCTTRLSFHKRSRYLKNDYQFFDTLKAKDRKIRGNCNSLIKVKFHELESSSPLTLNRFHTLFWCFHCWLWLSKCRLGSGNTFRNLSYIYDCFRENNSWLNFYHTCFIRSEVCLLIQLIGE